MKFIREYRDYGTGADNYKAGIRVTVTAMHLVVVLITEE